MTLTPQEKYLLVQYESATKRLSSLGPTAEKEFRDAYQKLVRAGLAQQIRLKYRGR
jgi:hypothetical protein